jgi:phage-related protein
LAADQGGKIYVVNAGNGIYYPTARINGPVLNPALRNNTLGKDLRFTIELAAGDYLDIDFKRKTVVDKTGLNRYSIKSGDWWHLQPGTNEIRFLADAYDASAFVNFYWRDSWLGI